MRADGGTVLAFLLTRAGQQREVCTTPPWLKGTQEQDPGAMECGAGRLSYQDQRGHGPETSVRRGREFGALQTPQRAGERLDLGSLGPQLPPVIDVPLPRLLSAVAAPGQLCVSSRLQTDLARPACIRSVITGAILVLRVPESRYFIKSL